MVQADMEPGFARIRLTVIAAVCVAFVMSQFLRSSVGVIAPDLATDLGLSADQLGLLSGSFFLSFAIAQIPAGMALDRFGTRRTLAVLLGLAVAGALLFAMATNAAMLIVARVAMGVGCSAVLMGALSLISRWYPPARFAALTGTVLAVGGFGMLASTAPFAWVTQLIGWRTGFVVAATAIALAALAILRTVRDAPAGHPFHARQAVSVRESLSGVYQAARQRDVLPVFVMYFFSYACFIALLGLWGGPYLADVHGLGLDGRGRVLLVMAVAQGCGVLLISRVDRMLGTRKWIVFSGAVTMTLLIGVLGFWPQMPLPAVIVLFAAIGFGFGFNPVLIAHGRDLFAEPILARGLTLLNVGTMGGAFTVQYLSALVLSAFVPASGRADAQAYGACFLSLAVMLGLAAAIYVFAADRPPGDSESLGERVGP